MMTGSLKINPIFTGINKPGYEKVLIVHGAGHDVMLYKPKSTGRKNK